MFTQKFIRIYHSVQEIGPFQLFFRIWRSAKPRPMINVIFQFLVPDFVNINVSAKFYQNIPNGLKVIVSLFSVFEPRQNLDQSQMSFDNLTGYILSVSIRRQNFITIFHSVQGVGPFFTFSEFGARQSLNRSKMSFRSLVG